MISAWLRIEMGEPRKMASLNRIIKENGFMEAWYED
jgi:hypothetical protein